jgi:nicotinamide mononucleotide transporter PnuC
MNFIINSIKSLSKTAKTIWLGSLIVICLSFFFFGNTDYLTLVASLIGATSLIFAAKGNVIGPILSVAFSIIYAVISFQMLDFGEMITYLGMTAPVSAAAVFAWLKNPFNGNKADVKINHIRPREYLFLAFLAIVVTIIFYFILKFFNTASLIMSTISVLTSFLACYLTVRRSEFYAVAYAANVVVLIILWVIAALIDFIYLGMLICFLIFLVNDVYGFFQWSKSKKRQRARGAR